MRWIRSIMMTMVNSMLANPGCEYIWLVRAFHWQIFKPQCCTLVDVSGCHCDCSWVRNWSQNWLANFECLFFIMWVGGGCSYLSSISTNFIANKINFVRNVDVISCSCMSNKSSSFLEVKTLNLIFERLSPSSFFRMISNNVHNIINHCSFIIVNKDQIFVLRV